MSVITSSVSDVVALTASGGDDIAAFEALLVAGRTIHLPSPLYKLSRELHVTVSECNIIGTGHETTEIRRITNAGDAVIRWGPAEDISLPLSTWPVNGGGLERIKLNANSLADYALHQRVHYRGVFRNLTLTQPVLAALKTSNFDTAGAYNVVQFCQYEDIFTFSLGTSIGVHIEGAYHLRFDGLLVSHADTSVGIYLEDVDDAFFYDWSVVGVGGTSIELGASTTGNHARNCTFIGGFGLTGGQAIIARHGTYNSRDNLFLGLSTEDVTNPAITIENGAMCRVVWNDGMHTLSRDLNSSEIEEEFAGTGTADGTIGRLGWTKIGSTSFAYGAMEAQHPGVGAVTTSGTGLCGLIASPVGAGTLQMSSANFDLDAIVKAGSGSDSTSMYRVGWGNDPTADPPDDGIWYEKLYADTTWFAVTSLAGVKTRQTVGSVTANWIHFRMMRRHSSTIGYIVGSFLNNENVTALLFNSGGVFPTVMLSPFIQARNSAGSARTFSVDYMRQTITGMTRR